MTPSPALFIPLRAKILPNKHAPNVPNNLLRNPNFCSLASFWTVSVTPFNNKPESSRDFTILIISSISSVDIINVVSCEAEDEGRLWPDPNIFFCIPASAADAAAVIPKGIKTLLANGLITFSINGNPVFSNGSNNLPRNPPDCILDNWVFDNLISVDKWLAKALRRFGTYLLVNNNLWEKLVSLSPIIFDDNLKTTSVLFFVANFSLLSFTFKLLYCVIPYR